MHVFNLICLSFANRKIIQLFWSYLGKIGKKYSPFLFSVFPDNQNNCLMCFDLIFFNSFATLQVKQYFFLKLKCIEMNNENCKLLNISETAINNDFHYHFSLQIDSIFFNRNFFLFKFAYLKTNLQWLFEDCKKVSSHPVHSYFSHFLKWKNGAGQLEFFCGYILYEGYSRIIAHTKLDIYVFDNYPKNTLE